VNTQLPAGRVNDFYQYRHYQFAIAYHYAYVCTVSTRNKKYTLRVRVWVDAEEGPYLGIGRVILLQKIKETGSITNAAKAMKMSYRQAWQFVEDMNKRSKKPLVEKILGGKNGSGSALTEAGQNAIDTFYRLEKEIKTIIEKKSKDLHF